MDPEQIYKKTYIAPKVIKNLIEGNFEKLGNRAKALGFVAILERELGLDLRELKEQIESYFGAAVHKEPLRVEEKEFENKQAPLFITVILLVAVAIGIYVWMGEKARNQSETTPKDFLTVQSSSSSFFVEANESNSSSSIRQERTASSQEALRSEKSNGSEANESEANKTLQSEETPHHPSVTILPKRKIWVGIIYLDNYKRKNYITSQPIELNTSKDQLIVTGHGLFKVDVDGNITEFKERGKQRLLYRAGVLQKIDRATFKQLNRGKDW